MTTPSPRRTEFPVRRGRNAAALVLLLVLSGLAFYVASAERDSLGWSYWWVPIFPFLAAVTAYRLFRPRVPLALDEQGVAVAAGTALIGLRTRIEWRAIKRLRVTAAGLLLIELRDTDRWSADKPWLVRANMRTNQRKFKAAAVQPLRELQGSAQEIVARLQSAAPVRVEAPEGLKGRA